MPRTTRDQTLQCLNHLCQMAEAEREKSLAGLPVRRLLDRAASATANHAAAQAQLAKERDESALVEAKGADLKDDIYDVGLVVARTLDYHEVAGQIDPERVAAARLSIFGGQDVRTATGSYSRAGELLTRVKTAFGLYPWLDLSGTLQARTEQVHQAYAVFLADRERESQETAAALAQAQDAEEQLFTLYYGSKDLIRGWLKVMGQDPGLMSTLFLDEDPRWAARLAPRKPTSKEPAKDPAPTPEPTKS